MRPVEYIVDQDLQAVTLQLEVSMIFSRPLRLVRFEVDVRLGEGIMLCLDRRLCSLEQNILIHIYTRSAQIRDSCDMTYSYPSSSKNRAGFPLST